MRNVTRVISTGLIPLLILGPVSGCVARHMPDWSKVEALPPGTKIEIQLYKDADLGQKSLRPAAASRKIKGDFISATPHEVSISDESQVSLHTKGFGQVVPRKLVRKVLAERELGKRWAGWVALGIGLAVGLNAFRAEADYVPGAQVLIGLAIPIGISVPFFLGSKMGGVYEVPLEFRDEHPK